MLDSMLSEKRDKYAARHIVRLLIETTVHKTKISSRIEFTAS